MSHITETALLRERAIERDLVDPRNLLPGVEGPVEIARTHGSVVFLAKSEVFKLKRAVDVGFFDFTTIGARQRDCDAEVRLNRRAAPTVYLGVCPVYQDDRGFSMNRARGEIADYVVHMRRLPDAASVASRLAEGSLEAADLDRLATFVARFYREADVHDPAPEELRTNVEENFEQCEDYVGKYVSRDGLEAIRSAQRSWLDRFAGQLAVRPSRDGHGDLRIEHAYLLPEGPALIDCISFNERFRIADPALDIAFFAMEMAREGHARLADSFCASFAYEFDDYDFYPLLDGYISYRAMVRAKVAAIVADTPGSSTALQARKGAEASTHFSLALTALQRPRTQPRVIAVGGLPASGKSTVARSLRWRHSAVVVSADSTRKCLAGCEKGEVAGAEAYTKGFTERVQAELLRRAGKVLESGRDVVLDTTFRRRVHRDVAHEFAREHDAQFLFVECVAPIDVLRSRIRARRGDVSDADEGILDAFLADHDPVVEVAGEQHVCLDTTVGCDRVEVAIDGLVDRGWGD